MTDNFVSPGTILSNLDHGIAGPGTYVLNGFIYASLFGKLEQNEVDDNKIEFSVISKKPTTVIPKVGDIVICKVTQINLRNVNLEIISIENGETLPTTFPGIIKSTDIRSFDRDTVDVYRSYRPGDIVRALVLSLGDSRSYYLSTARTNLGVIYAEGPAKVHMVAIDYESMECPVTKNIEHRKVADLSGVKTKEE